MDIKSTVLKTFNDTVKNAHVNTELKKALLNHPNMRVFVQNIYAELVGVEQIRASKQKPRLKKTTIESYVKDMTNHFIMQFNHVAEVKAMSDLEKLRRSSEIQKQKDLEASADGKLTGEYEELNQIVIGETKVKSL